jgi:hypothetical protein
MGGGQPISKPARWVNFIELLRPPLAATDCRKSLRHGHFLLPLAPFAGAFSGESLDRGWTPVRAENATTQGT